MRKLIFALAIAVTGAFASAALAPVEAAPVSPATTVSDIVKSSGVAENVHWRPYRHWHRRHWRHRHWRRHHRRCWWHRGHRHCRW
jgi:hypothetical protein